MVLGRSREGGGIPLLNCSQTWVSSGDKTAKKEVGVGRMDEVRSPSLFTAHATLSGAPDVSRTTRPGYPSCLCPLYSCFM